jgi:hypothetical protein
MREPSRGIGGHDAASSPPIPEGKPVIQGDTLPIHAHPEPVEGYQEDVPGLIKM